MMSVLNMISALLAVLAALAWIWSSRVAVIYDGKPAIRPPGSSLPNPALLFQLDAKGRQIDLIPTLKRQSVWNGYAAILAAGAAFFQALVTIVPIFVHPVVIAPALP